MSDRWSPVAPDKLGAATYGPDGPAKGGMHFKRLDQLALEYLYGVR